MSVEVKHHQTWVGDEVRTVIESMTVDSRPVVVIDPEDSEQVERLLDTIHSPESKWRCSTTSDLADALREFANATPDEPAEDGWYAYDGGRQTMIFRLTRRQWYVITDSGQCDPCEWGYISQALGVWNLVRIPSEGVDQ